MEILPLSGKIHFCHCCELTTTPIMKNMKSLSITGLKQQKKPLSSLIIMISKTLENVDIILCQRTLIYVMNNWWRAVELF